MFHYFHDSDGNDANIVAGGDRIKAETTPSVLPPSSFPDPSCPPPPYCDSNQTYDYLIPMRVILENFLSNIFG